MSVIDLDCFYQDNYLSIDSKFLLVPSLSLIIIRVRQAVKPLVRVIRLGLRLGLFQLSLGILDVFRTNMRYRYRYRYR